MSSQSERLGLAALITFLGVNRGRVSWSIDRAYIFIITIASGDEADLSAMAAEIADAIDPG